MDLSSFQPVFNWIAEHPTWAGIAVFVISLCESLAIVGLFIPGVAMMFGIGALVAMGAMDLWATLIWAAAGAVAGDGISYWLGYHYKDRLRSMRPFKHFPKLMERGELYFQLHGGKSVIFGRFIGPVRPIIPVIAGMLGMTPARFLIFNIISATAWAPVYTLPGVIFGASLGLASEVATRLALAFIIVFAVLWITVWLIFKIYLLLQPRTAVIMDRLLLWGGEHRYASNLVSSVLDPKHPELRGLALLAFLLVTVAVGSITIGRKVLGHPLAQSDTTVSNFLQGLRTPWADQVMVYLAGLGSMSVLLVVSSSVILWLAVRRSWLALLHILGAAIFSVILILALRWSSTDLPFSGDFSTWSGAPVVVNTVLYGLLAVMITQGLSRSLRWLPYAVAGVLIVAIIFSRLYLGITLFSLALAGWLLAALWVMVLGAAYRRHTTVPVKPWGLSIVAFLAFIITSTINTGARYEADLIRLAPRHNTTTIEMEDWWTGSWEKLPAYRIDLEDRFKQPLTIQWNGSLHELSTRLIQHNWKEAQIVKIGNILHWLRVNPPVAELPLLPQVHDGRHDVLRMTYPSADDKRQWVLRLWTADTILSRTEQAVWLGNITSVQATAILPLLTFPVTTDEYYPPAEILKPVLSALDWKIVKRPLAIQSPWNGEVLLIRKQDITAPF